MTGRPLKVLLVSTDRRLLRHLSKFLGAFGYEVIQAAEPELGAAAVRGQTPDFALLDGRPDPGPVLDLCRNWNTGPEPAAVYTCLLVEEPRAAMLSEALEAGVDDFLAHPLVYGELLARLRAGARLLEFERRWKQQTRVDPLTGLPGLPALREARRERESPAVCVMADIDLLSAINEAFGRPVGDRVILAAAERLRNLCGPEERLYSLGGGRFVAMIEADEEHAAAWADTVRGLLAETEVAAGGDRLRFTASLGIASAPQGESADQAMARASQALVSAKQSGRSCVVRFGEFDDDVRAWADFAAPGKLFQRTNARDVMTPCTLFLKPEYPIDLAAAWIERCRLPALPVVETDGRLNGLLLAESVLRGPATGAALRVADLMSGDVPVYDETATFAALRDFFTRDSRPVIVVASAGRPTGLVTPDNLATLSTPLTTGSFAPESAACESSEFLMVPDLALG